MHPRPSNHEICKKIADALTALRDGKFTQVVTKHIYGDLADLELDSAEQQLPGLLIELLEEIQTIGPIECYAAANHHNGHTNLNSLAWSFGLTAGTVNAWAGRCI